VSAAAVTERPGRGESFLLLDVREPDEAERACIDGSTLVPVGELAERLAELEPWRDRPIVVYCHHGSRSERAARLLLEAGFRRVESLDGGIEGWSLTVDPDVPRY
jgi:adenylyltransferase/sulfurtransferase